MWTVKILVLALVAWAGAVNVIRKDAEKMTDIELHTLQAALHDLMEDDTEMGYQAISGYHGAPAACIHNDHPIACCIHGMPTFPFWHRAYTVHMERALLEKRDIVGIPYWDWTESLTHLPSFVNDPIYIDSHSGKAQTNYWHRGEIKFKREKTARAVDDRLFEKVETGHHTRLMEGILDALEQDEFCKFEIQFELAHNAIHYLVGGNHEYSMSNLEYTAYDPIFFLHHSNVDRIFAIWQRLQELRGKDPKAVHCAHDLIHNKMEPFSRASNPIQLTRDHSKPDSLFDYHQLGYSYDSLKLNGMSPEDLKTFLDQRSARERAFANFRLHGIKGSADVRVYVCVPNHNSRHADHCENAGHFFILGGQSEMAWSFYRPYYFDVTETVHHLDLPLDGNFYVKAELRSSNGTAIPEGAIPQPTVAHRTRKGFTDPPMSRGQHDLIVRKNVEHLTREESYSLAKAMERFQHDASVDGYQATVEYHGLPARCPEPDAKDRYACCIHGMAIFPHWHRLFVTQIEDGLVRRGSPIGVPYWDWTRPMTHLPEFASKETYADSHGQPHHNPFFNANISFEQQGHHTSRDVDSRLFERPTFGDHTSLFDGILYAFEQEDFCDFEIQFEITHNNIHAWVGGGEKYSMSSLHYTGFDPLFYLHHSNVDRLWAIWQSLQIRRHKPYRAHCAMSMEHMPLKPFAFRSPLNNNEKTHSNAVPNHIYDYEDVLHYTYDDLSFGGMTLAEIEEMIHQHQQHERVFAGFQLSGIGTSANVNIYINKEGSAPHKAGTFAVLGGSKEMKWGFDRLFKYEITDELKALSLGVDDAYTITHDITDVDGTVLSSDLIHPAAIISEPAHVTFEEGKASKIVRKNVDSLSPEEVNDLRHAMSLLEADKSPNGFQQIGSYHGEPNWCPNPEAEHKYACCVHGMAVFPHWHRLFTVQSENALRKHGYQGALPYWDWTRPISHLPNLVKEEKYTDPSDGTEKHNPWFNGHIDSIGKDTEREVRDDLFSTPEFGHYTTPAQQVLLALEQDDFCTFEVQYEIAHNFIHALVGGTKPYGMASLRYTAFDPIFFLHHSNTDRIWAIWQALQKYRGKPYYSANCALAAMRKPLQPFGLTSDVNPDSVTREHAVPFHVFDYKRAFHYKYDNLEFNGLSISQLNKEIARIKSHDRVFVGFLLSGIKKSSLVKFKICTNDDLCQEAGEFYLLGDENEMPWAYDRVFKYDITDKLDDLDLSYDDHLHITYEVFDLTGASLGTHLFPTPSIIHDPGTGTRGTHGYHEEVTAASHIRKNLNDLNSGEMESLRSAFLDIEHDGTYESIAKFHGKPGLCPSNGRNYACCIHGMPIFPQWHRLYVVQVENALLEKGSAVSVPYWDWTQHMDHLPHLIDDPTYFNSREQRYDPNPFFRGQITLENAVTTRDPKEGLFDNKFFYDNVLLALEQTYFCDFEIQLEIIHNALHALIGGKSEYSMSSLDYAAFDPVFFLHHANVDRIWAIWQELQRYRQLHYEEADCAIDLMQTPIKPFSDSTMNHDPVTLKYSKPQDTFDYQNHFHYKYDNLEFNHMNIPSLEKVLQDRKRHDRVFAGFLLHNIGTSAEVHIYICTKISKRERNCDHHAGFFSILGGETEMPFNFDRLYKFEITHTLHDLGIDLHEGLFDIDIDVHSTNGSSLDKHIFHDPTIIFEPGTDSHQSGEGKSHDVLIRKEISRLSPREKVSLIDALRAMQNDHSADGFQAIASFHALPPLCPAPAAADRVACCVHGMATFPQWHRLYTVQMQDALRRHGAIVGIPYWDWTRPVTKLPDLVTAETFHDPIHNKDLPNPFFKADIEIEGEGVHTARDVNEDRLFHSETTEGYHNWFFENVLLALEQDHYCDFEIQFEIVHNAIHSWVGGKEVHGIGHLHYAAYDPLFFIHHSQTDRIWAIWQKLQRYRGLSGSEANCAVELMRTPLKPFSFGAPYNLNDQTHDFSKPEDTFDYSKYGYRYDSLELEGRSIARIDALIKEREAQDRTFAGFLLRGFGSSATVDINVCRADSSCKEAGYFTILGGEKEMPWAFDRLYKYDITHTLEEMHLSHEDMFTVGVLITSYNGTVLSKDLIPTPSILFVPGSHSVHSHKQTPNRIRHEISELSKRDIASLNSALTDLYDDDGPDGFDAIAAFHGLPTKCQDSHNHEIACCIHGMPTFPHWHRLYTLHMEQALRRHGSSVAIPYWDWTKPITELPHLLTDGEYKDVWQDSVLANPFARGYVKSANTFTIRDIQDDLYHTSGTHSMLFDQALLALEQNDYCDFEVQFEVMHNTIHYLVGGRQVYAFSSLHYASYDPIFFIHHSFVDKIWAIWQALQKNRRHSYNRADCAVSLMGKPMRPFNMDINHNPFTKSHAIPNTLFDYEALGYDYDHLDMGGLNLHQIEDEIKKKQSHARVFAGFLLHGIGTSADIHFDICKSSEDCHRAGVIFMLGGSAEMSWHYNRLYKYDITEALHEAEINPEDVLHDEETFYIKVSLVAVNGSVLSPSILHKPTLIYEPGHGHEKGHETNRVAGHGVRKNVNTLSVGEIKNLRKALTAVMADHGENGYQAIAAFHGNPPMCPMPDGKNYSCCTHGMATFLHWHRLFTKQMEDALTKHGAHVGIPYWDWTAAFTELPSLVTDSDHNPFHEGHIDYLGVSTSREPREALFNDPERESTSFFYRQVMLALEQTDFCQFEVQFEVTHNAIHSWTGGHSPYGMSTLEYTAYDPLFFLHHSNTDRLWAIWQALQKHRGLPYDHANCEIQVMKQPLRPFSDGINHNHVTKNNARPTDVFDYSHLNYQYDDLIFHGHSIPELDKLLEARKKEDRTFAVFLLHSIETSADIEFDICHGGKCVFAGTFALLGGEHAMSWSYDRLFRYDITPILQKEGLRHDSEFTFKLKIVATNDAHLSSDIIKLPTIEHDPSEHHDEGHHDEHDDDTHAHTVRKDLDELTLSEITDLRDAMYKLQNDHGKGGFEAIAGFHGYPNKCPEVADEHYPCCVHGMPVFPHWHRLHTIQFERALKRHGAHLGIPYWDWTKKMNGLPSFFGDASHENPFYKFHITSKNQDTSREVNNHLFQQPKFGDHDYMFYFCLQALEEDNFCDFEVQYEMLHNAIHSWVGGTHEVSMATLDYSAFDPIFMIHHSSLDRVWIIWQELQKRRHRPYNSESCAGNMMHVPLHPFNYESVNEDAFTRENSKPDVVYDHHIFDYEYDHLSLRGHNIDKLEKIIHNLRSEERIFAGIVLYGVRISANVTVYIRGDDSDQEDYAGTFAILGGPTEMPWSYERVYRFDITHAVHDLNIPSDDHIHVRMDVIAYNGAKVDIRLPDPFLIHRPAHSNNDVLVIPVGSDLHLPPKVVVKRGTKIKFTPVDSVIDKAMVNLGSYTAMFRCIVPPYAYHGFELNRVYNVKPGDYFVTGGTKALCEKNVRIHIHVDDE